MADDEDEEDGATRINLDRPAAAFLPTDEDEEDGATRINLDHPAATLHQPPLAEDEDGATRLNLDSADTAILPTPAGDEESTSTGEEESDTPRKRRSRKPAEQEESGALPVGQMLMWYRIEKVLGQGGFGITYKALDTKLNNFVAIKEYLPVQIAKRGDKFRISANGPAQQEMFEKGRHRFLDEAQTLAQFKHANLVRVVTFFEDFNTAYMVMEYEDGDSLAAVLKEKSTLEEAALLKIIMPLLQGLSELHQAGFIHRDVKPDNIFIRRKNGTPVLLDFGSTRKMSSFREPDGGSEMVMTTMLTPSYAPMEQYFEDASRQGPWTDIYAIGAVMYRAISGRKPPVAPQRSNALMRGDADPLLPASQVGAGRYSAALLNAIDLALQVIETNRPRSISAWMEATPATAGLDAETAASLMEGAGGRESARWRQVMLVLAFLGVTAMGAGVYLWSEMVSGPKILSQEQKWAAETEAIRKQAELGEPAAMVQFGQRLVAGRGIGRDASQGLAWYRKAADLQSGEAQYLLGMANAEGKLVPRDDAQAVAWWQLAANNHHPAAQFQLGRSLEEGRGVAVDGDLARSLYQLAAEAGQAEAQFRLGEILLQTEGADIQAMLDWFRKASDQNHPMAAWRLAQLHLYLKEEDKAVYYMQLAAEREVPEARYQWGIRLIQGQGVTQNLENGGHWIQMAAEQGLPDAMMEFGVVLEEGIGRAKEPAQAMRWYRQAAEKGVVRAQALLGDIFLAGRNVTRSTVEAAKWFRSAAAAGDARSQSILGMFYLAGEGVPRDLTAAAEWFQQAAKQGRADAQNSLAALYEHGRGVPKDLPRALEWYLLAAQQGHIEACNNLGWMYEDGRGVAKNLTEAAKWYRLAAEQGDARAQNSLAWMYEDGRGVRKDVVQAFVWYALSAAGGNEKALKNLEILSRGMSTAQIEEGKQRIRQFQTKHTQAKGGP